MPGWLPQPPAGASIKERCGDHVHSATGFLCSHTLIPGQGAAGLIHIAAGLSEVPAVQSAIDPVSTYPSVTIRDLHERPSMVHIHQDEAGFRFSAAKIYPGIPVLYLGTV